MRVITISVILLLTLSSTNVNRLHALYILFLVVVEINIFFQINSKSFHVNVCNLNLAITAG